MLRALLLLAALDLAAYGPRTLGIGFYHDDWTHLELCQNAGSVAGSLRDLARRDFVVRPGQIPAFSLCHAPGGSNPLSYQIYLHLMTVACAALLFALLRDLTKSPELALAAAALGLLHPAKAAFHRWATNTPQDTALALVLASLLLQTRWLATRRGTLALWAQAAYLAGIFTHESTALMPALLAGAICARRKIEGARWSASLGAAAKASGPYAVSLLALAAWQALAAPLLLGSRSPKSLVLWPGHALRAYAMGLDNLFGRVLYVSWRTVGFEVGSDGLWRVLAGLALGIGLARLWSRCRSPWGPRRAWTVALAAGGCGIAAGYAPYAVADGYVPQLFGVMSRTNGPAAWAGGVALAGALAGIGEALSKRRAGGSWTAPAMAAGLVWFFLITNWFAAKAWADSWTLQTEILSRLGRHAPSLPESAVVILSETPLSLYGANVFTTSWDFSSALRLTTRRKDLSGNVAGPHFFLEPDGAAEKAGATVLWRAGYERLYRYRFQRDALERLPGPPAKTLPPCGGQSPASLPRGEGRGSVRGG